jgi:hypothetical protein
MAFNYQSLKNIRSDGIIDGTISTADIADGNVYAGNVASGNITGAKIGSGQINTTTSTVASTALPISKGGLNKNSYGGAYQALYSDGSNPQYSNHGIYGMQVFTGSSTWSRPTGVRYIKVQVQGGGGGGSGHGEGGGAGGYAERILDVTGISSVSVYVGGGGSGTYYSGAGGNGDYASFGPYVSAGSGHGANRQNQHSGGVSGVGSGGNLNLHMGGGLSHHAYSAQSCADTFFGGGAPSSHPQGGHFAHNHQGHSAPGTGGAGAHFHGHRGSDGRPGLVIVTMYY